MSTSKTITEEEAFKINLINLAKHHKEHCHGEDCNISLYLLRKVGEKAGIVFTDDEKRYFM